MLSTNSNNSANDNNLSRRSFTPLVLPSTHVATAQNHMHQADSPALLRIPCVLNVAIQATGGHAVGAAVAHMPSRNQMALRRSKAAAAVTTSNMGIDEQMW